MVKGSETMRFNFWDAKVRLNRDVAVVLEVCPVGGHNMNGKVERKIREVKRSLSKALSNDRLSIMQWETLVASISNSINNMPLALGSAKSNLECMDLLTPNRLKLGRNNERSPVGVISVVHELNKTIQENQRISKTSL